MFLCEYYVILKNTYLKNICKQLLLGVRTVAPVGDCPHRGQLLPRTIAPMENCPPLRIASRKTTPPPPPPPPPPRPPPPLHPPPEKCPLTIKISLKIIAPTQGNSPQQVLRVNWGKLWTEEHYTIIYKYCNLRATYCSFHIFFYKF